MNDLDMILRLLLSLALGSIIGYQREREGKEAGLRTHVLICVGSALFTVVSIFAFGEDQARVASGIVAGIGFIGAGTILKRESGAVKGLTTAASIWITAAIGLAAGSGLFLISLISTVIAMVVLIYHPHIPQHRDPGE